MARLSGSTRRSEESRKRDIRDVQKRKRYLIQQISRLQSPGGGARSTGTRKTQLKRFREELARLGGSGNLPKSTRSGGSHEKGMSNLGSNYKKEEKKATDKANKWRKSDDYKKGVKKHNESLKIKNKKTNKDSGNSSSSSSSSSSSDSKNTNRLKLRAGLSERQIDSRIRYLKRSNKASDRMKIERLEGLKKKKKK